MSQSIVDAIANSTHSPSSVDSSTSNSSTPNPWNVSEQSTPALPENLTISTNVISSDNNSGDQTKKNNNDCADILAKLTPEQLNSLKQYLKQSAHEINSESVPPVQTESFSNKNENSYPARRIQSDLVNSVSTMEMKDYSSPSRHIPSACSKNETVRPVQNHSSAPNSASLPTSKNDDSPSAIRCIQSAPVISNSYCFDLKDFSPLRRGTPVEDYGTERKISPFFASPGASSDLSVVLEKLRNIEQSESKHSASIPLLQSRSNIETSSGNVYETAKFSNLKSKSALLPNQMNHCAQQSNFTSSSNNKNPFDRLFSQQNQAFHQMSNGSPLGEVKFPNEQFVSSIKCDNEQFLKRVDEIRSTLNMMFCSSPASSHSNISPLVRSNFVTPPLHHHQSGSKQHSFYDATPSPDISKSIPTPPGFGPLPKNDRDSIKSNNQANLNFLRRNSLPVSVMRKLITQDTTPESGNNNGPSPNTRSNDHQSSGGKSRENSSLSQIPPPNLPLLRRPSFQSIREEPSSNRRYNDKVSPDSVVKAVKSCPTRIQASPMNTRSTKSCVDIGTTTNNNNKIDKGKYFVLPEAFWEKNSSQASCSNVHSNSSATSNFSQPQIEHVRREVLGRELHASAAGYNPLDDPIISEIEMELSDCGIKEKRTPRIANVSRNSTNKFDQFLASIADNFDQDLSLQDNNSFVMFDSEHKEKTPPICSSTVNAPLSASTVSTVSPPAVANSNGFATLGSAVPMHIPHSAMHQPQTFAPSFQTLAAIQPNQFGQIFGLNYFNAIPQTTSASHQPTGHHPPLPFAHFMTTAGPSTVPHSHAAHPGTGGPMTPSQCLALLASSNHQLDPRIMLELGKDDLELKAKDHREAASRVSECESVYSITSFDFKPPADAIYSTKVFLGGVPWDMNNEDMMEVFGQFGAESIQRPGKDVRLSRSSQGLDKAGYLYLLFDSESNVNRLVEACKLEFSENGHKYFYTLISKRSKKEKRVQVIPWNTADSCAVMNPQAKGDQSRTVFLGALHGMMNASSIAQALTLIFGPIEYVSLDTDKYKYPMGSGRAMFTTKEAYYKAISAGFVRVKSERFEKTIQIDPFIDDRNCTRCFYEKGPVFCKTCIKYYCKNCWNLCHLDDSLKNHTILMKSRINSK